MKYRTKIMGIIAVTVVICAAMPGCSKKDSGSQQVNAFSTESAESKAPSADSAVSIPNDNTQDKEAAGIGVLDTEVIFELRSPRMSGQEVLNLQNRLLSLGFSALGAADGYYGPMAEGIIKNIQVFAGFESDGKVNRTLLNFIFDDSKAPLLKNISTVSAYDLNNLIKTEDLYYSEPSEQGDDWGPRAWVYYSSSDKKAKVIEYFMDFWSAVEMTCYLISDTGYFVKYKSFHLGTLEIYYEGMFLVSNNDISDIENGFLRRINDPDRYEEFREGIIDRVNDIKKIFSETL